MKRIELRSPMGWQLFDFWALVIVAVLGLFLIMFRMIDWPGADDCCNGSAVTLVGSTNMDNNAWMHQDTNWLGCDAALSATYLGFESGSEVLSHKGKIILVKLASCLTQSSYIIIGHSDNVGSQEANLLLSSKRAKSVKNYLIGQGIESQNLTVKGVGEVDPVADNNTEIGRQRNRRIEFVIR